MRGDERLNLRDLYVFPSPSNPDNTVLVMTANSDGDALNPDAVYRINVDNTGDLRPDFAFSFVFSEPAADGTQTYDLYLAVDGDAEEPQAVGSRTCTGVALSRGTEIAVHRSGSFTVFAGVRSDPLFCDLGGLRNLSSGPYTGGDPWTGVDDTADTNVVAMVVELPTSAMAADPDVRVWGLCTMRTDNGWTHVDRVGHPVIRAFLTDDVATRLAYYHTNPIRDRDRWIGGFIARMGQIGGYTRAEAIAKLEDEGTLPDVLTYHPGKPAGYPNGRSFADDVVNYRAAFVTKGKCPPSGVRPHTDILDEFPYLGQPH